MVEGNCLWCLVCLPRVRPCSLPGPSTSSAPPFCHSAPQFPAWQPCYGSVSPHTGGGHGGHDHPPAQGQGPHHGHLAEPGTRSSRASSPSAPPSWLLELSNAAHMARTCWGSGLGRWGLLGVVLLPLILSWIMKPSSGCCDYESHSFQKRE